MLRRYNLCSILLSLICLWASHGAHASTETAPAGVGIFIYKYVHGDVPSSFGQTGVEQSLNVNATLGSSILKNLSPATASAYDELAKIDPQMAANLNLGRIDLDPKVSASINGFGLAWGITDKVMVVGSIPFYRADVTINGGYSSTESLNQTIAKLKAYANNSSLSQKSRDSANILSQVLQQLPSLRGEYLQGAIVNDYGYKPVGDWAGTGQGDFDFFTQVRFLEQGPYKQAVKVGQVFPTGRVDDPDNLLDIPFGTGYYTSYIESMHDLTVLPQIDLMLSLGARYDYNWATTRTYRLSPDSSFPLSREKENVNTKPGNSWTLSSEIGSEVFGGISWDMNYAIKKKYRDNAEGINHNYDYGILTETSASSSNTIGAGITYSTVNAFKRKKFPVPLMIGIEGTKVLNGVNTEKLQTLALEMKVFF